jgi:hypothetical protein
MISEEKLADIEAGRVTIEELPFLLVELVAEVRVSRARGEVLAAGSSRLPNSTRASLMTLINVAVCRMYGTSLPALIDMPTNGKRVRQRAVDSHPRMVAMYLCRHLLLMTVTDIADYYGRRDHTTTTHAVETIERAIETNPQRAREVQALRDELEPKMLAIAGKTEEPPAGGPSADAAP